MANDCITKYYFEGPKQDIRTFAQKLLEWTSTYNEELIEEINSERIHRARIEGKTPELFDLEKGTYLKKRFINLMYNADPSKIYPEIDIYGEIIYSNIESLLSDNNNPNPILYLETNTEWTASNSVWYSILDSYFPKIKFYYYEQEPGFFIFNTNDLERKYFQIDYCIYDRNNTIFKPQDRAYFLSLINLSEKEVIDTLRAFFHDSTSSSIDLIKKAKQEYKLSFNKIKYISTEIEKTQLIRRNIPFQKLDKKFLINTNRPYPYLIKMQANGKRDIDFSIKIFYDNKICIDNLQVKINLFDLESFFLRKNAKKIVSILQQRFYEIHEQWLTASIDFCSTDIIHNTLISIKLRKSIYHITIKTKTPFIGTNRFPSYEKVNIQFEKPSLKNYVSISEDDDLDYQSDFDVKDLKDEQISKKHVYHIISLVIYALLDIPDDDLENITIKEQNFLN